MVAAADGYPVGSSSLHPLTCRSGQLQNVTQHHEYTHSYSQQPVSKPQKYATNQDIVPQYIVRHNVNVISQDCEYFEPEKTYHLLGSQDQQFVDETLYGCQRLQRQDVAYQASLESPTPCYTELAVVGAQADEQALQQVGYEQMTFETEPDCDGLPQISSQYDPNAEISASLLDYQDDDDEIEDDDEEEDDEADEEDEEEDQDGDQQGERNRSDDLNTGQTNRPARKDTKRPTTSRQLAASSSSASDAGLKNAPRCAQETLNKLRQMLQFRRGCGTTRQNFVTPAAPNTSDSCIQIGQEAQQQQAAQARQLTRTDPSGQSANSLCNSNQQASQTYQLGDARKLNKTNEARVSLSESDVSGSESAFESGSQSSESDTETRRRSSGHYGAIGEQLRTNHKRKFADPSADSCLRKAVRPNYSIQTRASRRLQS